MQIWIYDLQIGQNKSQNCKNQKSESMTPEMEILSFRKNSPSYWLRYFAIQSYVGCSNCKAEHIRRFCISVSFGAIFTAERLRFLEYEENDSIAALLCSATAVESDCIVYTQNVAKI
mgnify:CR=1 FL=1